MDIYYDAYFEHPSDETKKYLVWYVPYQDKNAASWQFGFWNNEDSTWDIVNSHASEYTIEFWTELPANPILKINAQNY